MARPSPADPLVASASVWLWHAPSAAVVVLCAVTALLTAAGDGAERAALAAVVVVVLATGAATYLDRHPPESRAQAAVPVLLLAAACLVHGAVGGDVATTFVSGSLPVAWLAFTYGPVGTATGIAGAVAVTVSPFVAGGAWPTTTADRLGVVLPPVALAVMALVAYRASRLLVTTREQVGARTDDLALQVAATEAVLDAVEGAVVVFVDGQAPTSNGRAASLLRRGWVLPERAGERVQPGPAVFEADRTTPVPPEDQTLVRAGRGETFGTRLHWIGPPGDQVAVACSARAVVSPRGARGTVFVGWDATELLDSMRVREEFVATVSHELRTPLTSILGYLELHEDAVAEGVADTVGRSHLSAVRRSARSLHERIGQLLAVATPAGRLSVQSVDVAALVARSAAEHRQAAGRAGLDLTLEAPEELAWPVDPTALERVVENLLGNAVKYTDAGSVAVAVGTDRGELVLTVTDTGNGMTETEVSHAFERFYRGERAARDAVPGLGVGLAVTKQLVEAHGGAVTVSSRPGTGTTFVVRLPDRQDGSSGGSSSASMR